VGPDASSPDATMPEGSAPEAGPDATPDTSTSTFAQAVIIAVDADFLPDYAHLRAQAGSFPISASLASNYTQPVVPPLPQSGTLKFTAFTYSGGG
jgi:hypothetical protein